MRVSEVNSSCEAMLELYEGEEDSSSETKLELYVGEEDSSCETRLGVSHCDSSFSEMVLFLEFFWP